MYRAYTNVYIYRCIGGIYWGQNPREPTPSVALNIGITHTSTTIYTSENIHIHQENGPDKTCANFTNINGTLMHRRRKYHSMQKKWSACRATCSYLATTPSMTRVFLSQHTTISLPFGSRCQIHKYKYTNTNTLLQI